MKANKLHTLLKPIGWGDIEKEPFELYAMRVRPLLPNWPDEALETWLYRHYADAVSSYGWLPFEDMHFKEACWTTENIVNMVATPKLNMCDQQGQYILSGERGCKSFLSKYLLKNGTWPTAPLVLENSGRLTAPDGWLLGQPFHLIEGHLRIGYLRTLANVEPTRLLAEHRLWEVRL